MRRLLAFFICIPLLLPWTSCSKKENGDLDLTPRIESYNPDLIGRVIQDDEVFFQSWSEDRLYDGFILDLVDSGETGPEGIYEYATGRYLQFSAERRYRHYGDSLKYVLYCVDTGDVVITQEERPRKICDGLCPGEFYRIACEQYRTPAGAVEAFAQLSRKANRRYEDSSFFRKIGVVNSLLEAVDLDLSERMIPSGGFLYRFFFAMPFGAAMVVLKLSGSLLFAGLFFLLFFMISNMAYVRRVTRGGKMDYISALYWCFSVLAFLSFCCLLNTVVPSPEFRYGMTHYGFKEVFDSCYVSAYAGYKMSTVSAFSIVCLALLFLIDWFLSYANQGGSDKDPGPVFALILCALLCNGVLVYAAIIYLAFRVIQRLYVLFAPDKAMTVSHRPLFFLGGVIMLVYLLIPWAHDSATWSFPIINGFSFIWGTLAVSGAFLLIADFYDSKEVKVLPWDIALSDYLEQTISEKWSKRMTSFFFQNCFFTAGITSPVFLVICVLYTLFPDQDLVFVYGFCVLLIGPGLVFLIGNAKDIICGRSSAVIHNVWDIYMGKTDGLSDKDIIKNATVARIESSLGLLGVFAIVVLVFLLLRYMITPSP